MSEFVIALGWVGIYGVTALGGIGSALGCAIAGQAAIGAMLDTESGYGRYIGVSVMPSSQIIYGIVVMFTLSGIAAEDGGVTAQNGGAFFGIGFLAGIALLYAGIYQGNACASAITASKEKPEIFGLSLTPAAIVEGFSVFVFVFALVIAGSITA